MDGLTEKHMSDVKTMYQNRIDKTKEYAENVETAALDSQYQPEENITLPRHLEKLRDNFRIGIRDIKIEQEPRMVEQEYIRLMVATGSGNEKSTSTTTDMRKEIRKITKFLTDYGFEVKAPKKQ
jgi:CO dehydrogenase/acetyl-CoA synthase epsilon subunit